jgi:probable rRNA maturation factor
MSSWAARVLGRRGAGREIAVRVVAERESRALNKMWRGKDSATNVLSFPAPAQSRRGKPLDYRLPLGDLVICAEVVRREAVRQAKKLEAHWAHMVMHGALHLAGYDHEVGRSERLRMERREIAVLKSFGFGNPYT